jgi:hypothetical protein
MMGKERRRNREYLSDANIYSPLLTIEASGDLMTVSYFVLYVSTDRNGRLLYTTVFVPFGDCESNRVLLITMRCQFDRSNVVPYLHPIWRTGMKKISFQLILYQSQKGVLRHSNGECSGSSLCSPSRWLSGAPPTLDRSYPEEDLGALTTQKSVPRLMPSTQDRHATVWESLGNDFSQDAFTLRAVEWRNTCSVSCCPPFGVSLLVLPCRKKDGIVRQDGPSRGG